MGPKKQAVDTDTILADIDAKLAKLESMEKLLNKINEENELLRGMVAKKDAEITTLKTRLNAVEQYNRSWSIRINNLPVPKAEENNTLKVMETVYNAVILPIFQGALDNGDIDNIPSIYRVLETAHILPGKPNSTKPIIARFTNRYFRQILFTYKKEHAPRAAPTSSASASSKAPPRPAPYLYPFYEDLTADTFRRMRELAADQRVLACWSVGGLLRLKLNDDPSKIHKVKSIYATIDDILNSL
jgi:hypothetical protein